MCLLAVLIAALAISACATSSRNEAGDLVGYYAMVEGGFNESLNIEFTREGSYVLHHELFSCFIGSSSEPLITHNVEEGVWKLEGGVLLLEPKARTKDFPDASVYAPALAHRLIPKRDGFTRVLVNGDYPARFVLKKMPKPPPPAQAVPAP